MKAEILILKNGVKMKETELENELKRKIDEDQRVQDLQEEVTQLKALNYRFENDNEELKNEILTQKSNENEDNIFECNVCNHNFKQNVDFVDHIVANHTSNGKMDGDIEDKFKNT